MTAVDSTGKLEMLRALGADDVVDYTRTDFTRLGVRYDPIFDVPGDRPFSAFRRALTPDGRYVPIGHDQFGRSGRRLLGLVTRFVKLMLLARFVPLAAGKLTPLVDRAYPFSEVREAFRHLIEDETRGKVVLVPDRDAVRIP
ncbi:MAG TPA: zinc-binding dehydrogenase [Gemmatimonadales bacterium]|nr:zinc-binding dehydrogenase [Gemmatimonadales bacterium]